MNSKKQDTKIPLEEQTTKTLSVGLENLFNKIKDHPHIWKYFSLSCILLSLFVCGYYLIDLDDFQFPNYEKLVPTERINGFDDFGKGFTNGVFKNQIIFLGSSDGKVPDAITITSRKKFSEFKASYFKSADEFLKYLNIYLQALSARISSFNIKAIIFG